MLLHGNCLDKLKTLKDNSIDSIVTDPPYGLSFMGKSWDYDVPSEEIWKECLRVLKPGGHLLAFFGTRTYHRGVIKIEDAGFEIRDQIMWIYGSGFPKSTDISKRIDKEAGVERIAIGVNPSSRPNSKKQNMRGFDNRENAPEESAGVQSITAPATDSAKQWQGWGSALKPANEPIVVARKPLEKGLTLAQNVLKYGTGAINIDESRIEAKPRKTGTKSFDDNSSGTGSSLVGISLTRQQEYDLKDQGRWPANILFDEVTGIADWSRFFYVAKASKSERNAGLEGMPEKVNGFHNNGSSTTRLANQSERAAGLTKVEIEKAQNFHPTVKPIKLMQYLIKLVTPPQGTVLDPFMGSGSTGVAALKLGFKFVGCEMGEEYYQIAEKRIEAAL